MERTPIFGGTVYEYIDKFGCDEYTEKEQQ